MLYMMRGPLLLRRGPLTSEWRSSAWLICVRARGGVEARAAAE